MPLMDSANPMKPLQNPIPVGTHAADFITSLEIQARKPKE